jgi:hypothetical protein
MSSNPRTIKRKERKKRMIFPQMLIFESTYRFKKFGKPPMERKNYLGT